MNQFKKVLFAYDGSECANAALSDLRRAGLPEEAQVVVLSVAELWLAAPKSIGRVETNFSETSLTAFERAEAEAKEASQYIQAAFPHWEVKRETLIGSPARVLLERADEWQPDLIIVGSHGRSAVGRLFLGSVSQKVVTEAQCSVRVARGRATPPRTPVSVLIGVDGSPGSGAAVQAVAERAWPRGSEVRLVGAEFSAQPAVGDYLIGPYANWLSDEHAKMRLAIKEAEDKLSAAGLTVTAIVRESDPKQLLCAEAESWGADCIFVGAKKHRRLDRFLLGSVSAAVVARAHCSVEVVRP
jgi:nucleotide-binding universal stress UspA family protein